MTDDDMIRELEKTISKLYREICNPLSLPPWLWARCVFVLAYACSGLLAVRMGRAVRRLQRRRRDKRLSKAFMEMVRDSAKDPTIATILPVLGRDGKITYVPEDRQDEFLEPGDEILDIDRAEALEAQAAGDTP